MNIERLGKMWKIDFNLVLKIKILYVITKVKGKILILLYETLWGKHFWVHISLQNKPVMLDLSQYNHLKHYNFSIAQKSMFCAFRLVMHLCVLALNAGFNNVQLSL